MNRFTIVAIVFAVVPAFARGQQLPAPPVATPGPVTVKAMPVSCAPTLMEPLSVTPTIPSPGPCGTGCGVCDKKPGLFQSILNCFRRPTAETSAATVTTTCPPLVRIPVAKPACTTATCPAPVGPTCKTAHVLARPTHGGGCWEKLKTWYCWKPCGEQLLPILCPEPYHAPLFVYFPTCDEPTPGIPCASRKCGHGKTCETASCPTTGCPTGGCPVAAVGPVVSPMVYAVAGIPVAAPRPTAASVAAPPQVNLLSRPFTAP